MDIGALEIMLVFDELTNASTFSSITLTLINSTLSPPASSFFRLTTSSHVSSLIENNIIISVGNDDFYLISSIIDLATSAANTFVLLDGAAVQDLGGAKGEGGESEGGAATEAQERAQQMKVCPSWSS